MSRSGTTGSPASVVVAEQGFATIPRALLHDPSVPRDAKLVYLMLSSHVGGNASAWPSHRRMADLLGMSVSTVKRQLAWLRTNGHVEWQTRIGDNAARVANEYVLLAGSSSTEEVAKPGKRPRSDRARGRSEGTTPSSVGTDPSLSESEPVGLGERAEEESLNESQLTKPTADADTAQAIISAWCRWCVQRPPSRVVGQIAKLVGEMLAEGINPELIRRGLAAWTEKGLAPSLLPSVVNEVMNARGSPRRGQADVWTEAYNQDQQRTAL